MTRCRDLLGSGRYARKSNAREPLTLFSGSFSVCVRGGRGEGGGRRRVGPRSWFLSHDPSVLPSGVCGVCGVSLSILGHPLPPPPLISFGPVVLVLGQNSKSTAKPLSPSPSLSHAHAAHATAFPRKTFFPHANKNTAHARFKTSPPAHLLPFIEHGGTLRWRKIGTLKLFGPRFWFPIPGGRDGLIRERVRESKPSAPAPQPGPSSTQPNPAQAPPQAHETDRTNTYQPNPLAIHPTPRPRT